MSSIHLPKLISQRGKSSLEVERDNFEKTQTAAINKAINSLETPIKEKHVRSAILGTFHENGAGMFWSVCTRLQLQGNPILCWKFCNVLHKILREGHPNVILDSLKYNSHVTDLGKLWGHLKDGYGRLILAYTNLLVQKLKFHRKNPRIPGTLMMTDEQFMRLCGGDVNNYFEISVDMLDYLDEILSIQQAVFGSLDMSRSNSMTNSGQCRLHPLILCILDSCQLYDYIVKSLFKMHETLPPDTLTGHRDRFLTCYQRLKQFYLNSHNLQYFKNLVQVPALPDDPPNFLIASDFSKHVKPVAVLPDEPEVEMETPEVETVAFLIDTTPPQNDQFNQAFGDNNMGGFNFKGGPPPPDERDIIIERLTREVQQLREELARTRAEDQRVIESLRSDITRLEKILSELRISANKSLKEIDALKVELLATSVKAEAADKLQDTEKNAKVNEEKFKKMKDIYGKLREEHVTLLRNNAEVTKQIQSEKKLSVEKDQLIKESKSDLDRIGHERKVMEDSLQKSAGEVSAQLVVVSAQSSELERDKEACGLDPMFMHKWKNLETKLNNLGDARTKLDDELRRSQSEFSSLQDVLQKSHDDRHASEAQLTQELALIKENFNQKIQDLEKQLVDSKTDKKNTEIMMSNKMDDLHKRLLDRCISEGRAIINDAMDQTSNPHHFAVTCSAEFLLSRTEPVLAILKNLKSTHSGYCRDKQDLNGMVSVITNFSHHLGDCVLHGIATSHSAQIEPGEELLMACKNAGDNGLRVLDTIEKGGNSFDSDIDVVDKSIRRIILLAEALVPKIEDVNLAQIGDLVEDEMTATTSAIEQAASKMEEMLKKARDENTGIQLEVNERILDSCTDLMKAIKVLLENSRDLQKEIVSQGRGTSSAKEYYKKNHRWTEGLMSAAKAVGWGATNLLDAADKVVKGEGKFEELIVCSQDIAASTAQLVVSSKVKAERGSQGMANLSKSSKVVNQATGKVVASAKSGSQIIEDQNLMDFSSLTLHQAKRLEMQSQVRVLELESNLEKERFNLGRLRKEHYIMSGEFEDQMEEVDESGLNPQAALQYCANAKS